MKRTWIYLLPIVFYLAQAASVSAQPGSSIELPNKPKPFENRVLKSEKTGNKGFNAERRLYQNMVTHYNYYFNANNRLNTIINNAKASFRDDYTQPLLPFYNYSLDVTASNKGDIDSIIYRCAEGVLLHDLRNDWIDDMYYVLGRAYFLRKNFDSSTNCFRYINYAWAPKDDGYDIPIGSNASATDGEFSIATKEKSSIVKKIISKPPARNDALLALCRNYIETSHYTQASSLLEILRNDPNFPKRLQSQLQETLAYLAYKQNNFNSAASFLSKALGDAQSNLEESRWQFLIAQMYEKSHDSTDAITYYNKVVNRSPDPVMQVYANLNLIDISGTSKGNVMQQRLDALLRLGRKDRYAQYRDIIYYAAAKVELLLNDNTAAVSLLKKSIAASVINPKQKSLSFLMLADITYDNRSYILAHNYYDSILLGQISVQQDYDRAKLRQTALKIIAANLTTIHLEDSLQKIAAMSKADREAFLRKLARQLEKDAATLANNAQNPLNPASRAATPGNLFGNSASSSGGWYFNNSSLKATGYTSFQQTWGTRPNVDNWNLKSALDKAGTLKAVSKGTDSTSQSSLGGTRLAIYNTLLAKIPLTPEKINASNNNIAKALFGNGQTFENQLENYPAALDSYNELNHRFGKNDLTEKTLFNEIYCYTAVKNIPSADSCERALKALYSKGKLAHGLDSTVAVAPSSEANPATKIYDHIYDLFLNGNFDSARAEKQRADSLYGKTYWTPQLLYIEAVYYVSKREDSAAINRLHSLASLYPKSPLAEKANTMISVLKRRKDIENYLSALKIKRNEDEASPVTTIDNVTATPTQKPLVRNDSTISKVVKPIAPLIPKDTVAVVAGPKTFSFNSAEPQYVLIVLDSVAPVFASEAGNAFTRYNGNYFYNQRIPVSTTKLSDRYNLVLVGPFPSALEATQYIDKTRPKTAGSILPWLHGNKFSYSMISQSNIDLLKSNKDIEGYKKILHQALPQEF